MEVRRDYRYETLPEFTGNADGAMIIETTGEETGVYYIRDVEYCRRAGQSLTLQILVPYTRNSHIREALEGKGGTEQLPGIRYPCVVFVKGSAWMEQNLYSALPDYGHLAEQGFVVAVAQYRHSGIACFPAQAVDVNNAIRFLRTNAEKYFVDPGKILSGGNSSGGHTALFASILNDDGDPSGNLFPGVSSGVRGIINQYGSTDFTFEDSNPTMECHNLPDSPEGKVMGGANLRERPELAELLSVKSHITEATRIPPVLILHGTKDRIVNTWCSVKLYQHMRACKKQAELVILKGADHGGPEFFQGPALQAQVDFINRCLKDDNG